MLTLACGRTVTVDEKIRLNEWPDILLEQWSDEARHFPGWVQKALGCDLIARVAQSGRCYLLPYCCVQRAWPLNGRQWICAYGQKRARNVGYVSTSVAVPVATPMQPTIEAMLAAA